MTPHALSFPDAAQRSLQDTVLVWLTLCCAVAAFAFHFRLIGAVSLVQWDEYYTLDRSLGFARHDDWLGVYTNNAVTFRKPPLQFWMGAVLLGTGLPEVVALRLPSFLFAIGTAGATALLTATLAHGMVTARRAALFSVILLCCSVQFWNYALAAMLDMGATFFVTMALAATLRALRNPRWWAVSLTCVALGALQKTPVGVMAVAIALLVLWLSGVARQTGSAPFWQQQAFRRAALVALPLCLAWPALQILRHGGDAMSIYFGSEMADRFAPNSSRIAANPFETLRLILVQERTLRLGGLVAMIWLCLGRRRANVLPLLANVTVFGLAMHLAGGQIYDRYSLTLVPVLVACLAIVLSLLRPAAVSFSALCISVALSGGPLKEASHLMLRPDPKMARRLPLLTWAGNVLRPGERLVVCQQNIETRFFDSAVPIFAQLSETAFSIGGNLPPVSGTAPLLILCTPADIAPVQEQFINLARVGQREGYALYRALPNPDAPPLNLP